MTLTSTPKAWPLSRPPGGQAARDAWAAPAAAQGADKVNFTACVCKIQSLGQPWADPDFGSSLTVSSRDSQSNCWVNWKILGQPCEIQVDVALSPLPPPPVVLPPPFCAAGCAHHRGLRSGAQGNIRGVGR